MAALSTPHSLLMCQVIVIHFLTNMNVLSQKIESKFIFLFPNICSNLVLKILSQVFLPSHPLNRLFFVNIFCHKKNHNIYRITKIFAC